MLLLTEKFILLLVNEKRKKLERNTSDLIFYGLPVSIIVDMNNLKLIEIKEDETLEILSTKSEIGIFKHVFEELKNEAETNIRSWIRHLGTQSNRFLKLFIENMVVNGLLKEEFKKILFFKKRTIQTREVSVKIQLMHQLQEAIINPQKATIHTKILLALLYKCNKLDLCLNKGITETLRKAVYSEIKEEKFGKIVEELISERNELMNAIFSTYLINSSLV